MSPQGPDPLAGTNAPTTHLCEACDVEWRDSAATRLGMPSRCWLCAGPGKPRIANVIGMTSHPPPTLEGC